MDENKITLDPNDKDQQAAFALGMGVGHMKGVNDATAVVVVVVLAAPILMAMSPVIKPVVSGVKSKFKDWNEKRKLKKMQKLKAKMEKEEAE